MVTKFPKRIKILGSWWTIKATHEFNYELLGHTNSVTKEIHIRPNVEPEILIHEFCHAISDSFGTEISEEHCQLIGRGLYAILSDNPSVMKYLNQEIG